MKLNKVEKVIVVIIILGLILGLGIFMLVKPSFENIGKQQKVLDSYKTELNELNARLARLDTIDADIQTNKDNAKKYETKFYPDLTPYEASEIAMAYLQAANLEAHSISVSDMATHSLSLSYFMPADVDYAIKSYGKAVKADEERDVEVLEEGQFKDGNKTYSVILDSVANVRIIDEEGNEVKKNVYTDTMKKVYKAAICRYVARNAYQETTGVITATYEVKGRYEDYINFIDHIYSLEKATFFQSVAIPMTYIPEADEDDDSIYVDEAGYAHTRDEIVNKPGVEIAMEPDTEVHETISILFLSVEPTKSLSTLDIDGTTVVVDQRPAVY